jgi:hypothetical protein
MSDLHAQIRTYVEDTIERIDSDDVMIAVSSQPVVGDRTARRARPAWLAAGAAVLVLLLVGVPLMLLRGGESMTAAQPTTTAVSVTTTLPPTTEAPATTVTAATTTVPATTAVPATPDELTVTLAQVPTQSAFGVDDVILSVTVGGPGLVAVGEAIDEGGYATDAVVWTSADGVAWNRIVSPGVFGGIPSPVTGTDANQAMLDVVDGPMGLVAVGWVDVRTGDLDPPIWVSTDGLAWSRVTGNPDAFSPGPSIETITTGGPGYVAAGSDAAGHATIWVSPDGVAWTRIDQSLGDGYAASVITDIAQIDSGLVAVGFADPEWQQFPTGRPLAWTSRDGLSWDQVELGSEAGTLWAVAGTGEAALAVGNTSHNSAAWITLDGKMWSSPSPIVTLAEELWFWSALWDNDRLLVVGVWFPEYPFGEYPFPGSSAAVAWASHDAGATWYEAARISESDEGVFASTIDQRPAGFRDVIALGDGFVAVGGTGNGSAPVWIGTWTEE